MSELAVQVAKRVELGKRVGRERPR